MKFFWDTESVGLPDTQLPFYGQITFHINAR